MNHRGWIGSWVLLSDGDPVLKMPAHSLYN
jgi:hypothetical protein